MGRRKTKLRYLDKGALRRTQGTGWRLEGVHDLVAALRALGTEVQRSLEDAALAGGEVIREEAENLAPGPGVEKEVTKSGNYEVQVDIGHDKEHWYYQFFETGVDPHPIPRQKKRGQTLLVFEGRHGTVRTRFVRHPGMKRRPFLRPALDERGEEAIVAAGKVFREAIMAVVRRHGEGAG